MRTLSTESISQFPGSDAELSEIRWLPECGVRFSLLLGDGKMVHLTCTWITQLRMSLDFGKNSGKAMTSHIDYAPQGSHWQIRMDLQVQALSSLAVRR